MDLSKAQRRTLFVVWLTYGCFYLCRVNIGPARNEIERTFAIDPLEMGLVLGSLKIGYAIGQLLNGQFAERFGPRTSFHSAILLWAGAAFVAAALSSTLWRAKPVNT